MWRLFHFLCPRREEIPAHMNVGATAHITSLDQLLVQHNCAVIGVKTILGPSSLRGPPDWDKRRQLAYSLALLYSCLY